MILLSLTFIKRQLPSSFPAATPLQEENDYTVDGLLTDTILTDITAAPIAIGSAHRGYNAVGEVTHYLERGGNGVGTDSMSYTYTGDGRVSTEHSSDSGGSTYTYDSAGNLTSVFNLQPNGTTLITRYTYEYWDSAKQKEIYLQASNQAAPGWAPGFSSFTYDVNGHLTEVSDMAANRHLRYALDAQGLVLERNEIKGGQSSRTQYYYYLNGIGIGDAGGFGSSQTDYAAVLMHSAPASAQPIGSGDFDENYQSINDRYPAQTPGAYTLRAADIGGDLQQTLQHVALAVWGDASLWYLLEDANGLLPGMTLVENQSLVIPNVVANIHNNAATFKVYDPGEHIGDVAPSLPHPPAPAAHNKHCKNILEIIIVVIVAVIVTVLTDDLLDDPTWSWVGSVIGGATGAAAGNAAGQIVAKAEGLRDHFSWKEVGTAALTAELGSFVDTGSTLADALLRETLAQEVRIHRGEQEHFDWGQLAGAAVGSQIDDEAASTSNATATNGASLSGFATDVTAGFTKGAVRQGLSILANHQGHIDWDNLAANALGDALANALTASLPLHQGVQERRVEAKQRDYARRGYHYEVNPNGSLRLVTSRNQPGPGLANSAEPGLGVCKNFRVTGFSLTAASARRSGS